MVSPYPCQHCQVNAQGKKQKKKSKQAWISCIHMNSLGDFWIDGIYSSNLITPVLSNLKPRYLASSINASYTLPCAPRLSVIWYMTVSENISSWSLPFSLIPLTMIRSACSHIHNPLYLTWLVPVDCPIFQFLTSNMEHLRWNNTQKTRL